MKIKIYVNTLMQFREEKKYYFKVLIKTYFQSILK